MSLLEKHIENKVVEWAKRHGFLTPKVKFMENGYPDRLFVSPMGHTVWIEFKRPGEAPRPLQVHRMKELAMRRQVVACLDKYESAVELLRECLDPASIPDEGDKAPPESGSGGASSGSGAGKVVDLFGRNKDLKESRISAEDINRGPFAAHAEDVAGRNKEMDGIPGVIIHDTPRPEES